MFRGRLRFWIQCKLDRRAASAQKWSCLLLRCGRGELFWRDEGWLVWGDGEALVGEGFFLDSDVPAVEGELGLVFGELGGGGFDGDGFGFAGEERDVVVAAERGKDAVVGASVFKLEMGEECGGFGGVGEGGFDENSVFIVVAF